MQRAIKWHTEVLQLLAEFVWVTLLPMMAEASPQSEGQGTHPHWDNPSQHHSDQVTDPETKIPLPSTQHEVPTLAAWLQKPQPFVALLPDEIRLPDGGHGSRFPAPAPRAGGDEHPPRGRGRVVTQPGPGGAWPALSF